MEEDEVLHIGRLGLFPIDSHGQLSWPKGPLSRTALLPRNQTSVVCCSDSFKGRLRIRILWGRLGPLSSLGTTGTPEKKKDYEFSGPRN